jgi:hypothetical protein
VTREADKRVRTEPLAASVAGVRFEHHREPFGIGESRPRISWRVSTNVSGWVQQAYEIEVADQAGGQAWSSGRVESAESAESVLVPWEAPVLDSRARRTVRVRVWSAGDEAPSPWSEAAIVADQRGLAGQQRRSSLAAGSDAAEDGRPTPNSRESPQHGRKRFGREVR